MLSLLLAASLSLVPASDVHVGGMVGLQGSTLVGDDANDNAGWNADVGSNSSRSGLELGAFAEMESGHAGGRIGFAYSQKGCTREHSAPVRGDSWTQRLDYVEVPLELKLMSGDPRSPMRLCFLGGLYWAGLVSAWRTLDRVSNQDEWYGSAVGFSVGAGVQGVAAPVRVGVQVRLRRDVTTIFGPKANRDLDIHNQTAAVEFLVGI